jgi:MFS family permease
VSRPAENFSLVHGSSARPQRPVLKQLVFVQGARDGMIRIGMAVFILLAALGVAYLTGTPKILVVMVGFAFFITSFAIGVGGTGWLIQGEVFPTAVRGTAAAIGASVDWLANFVIILVLVFPALNTAIGLGWVLFAVLAVLAIAFIARFLPETKGLPLEDVVAVFERQTAPAKASPS